MFAAQELAKLHPPCVHDGGGGELCVALGQVPGVDQAEDVAQQLEVSCVLRRPSRGTRGTLGTCLSVACLFGRSSLPLRPRFLSHGLSNLSCAQLLGYCLGPALLCHPLCGFARRPLHLRCCRLPHSLQHAPHKLLQMARHDHPHQPELLHSIAPWPPLDAGGHQLGQ